MSTVLWRRKIKALPPTASPRAFQHHEYRWGCEVLWEKHAGWVGYSYTIEGDLYGFRPRVLDLYLCLVPYLPVHLCIPLRGTH